MKKKNDDLMNDFIKNLEKIAVQPYEKDQSLFNQINSIINGKHSKFSSVEDKVKDMQERSGYSAYLNKLKAETEDNHQKKVAQTKELNIELFNKYPQTKTTFDNLIRSTNGYWSVLALIDKVKSTYANDISDQALFNDKSLIEYLTKQNLQTKANTTNLDENKCGIIEVDDDIDLANDDAFIGLMPAKR